ncbi:peroxiredoxin-like 2C isoform X1 [Polyodon spathula]|uniref:peroxiredoxin-like 2C isoform X1 n=1 Tax=Polyodon spathula TaxID=7913 RepID=UPI001B7EBE45|nr:peroxiredoxin-like 2C isoform X1 [Polyodon spathula]
METTPPVTQQIGRNLHENRCKSVDIDVSDVQDCNVFDRQGNRLSFRSLYEEKKAIIVLVRHFLCYTCKEYVEDLAKIPKSFLSHADARLIVIGQSSHHHIDAFCQLTGYPHEMYVDPEKEVYKKLGMNRGDTFIKAAGHSLHVKSNMFTGSLKSIWRAMTSTVFDFQGDPNQQGGALIIGPGAEVHFAHFDMNRLDHMPINWLLEQAGVQTVDFADQPIIHV